MEDELVVKLDPVLAGEDATEVRFHFFRGIPLRQPQASGDPEDVRIHGERRYAKGIGQHHIGGFLSHPGESPQSGGVRGHLAPMSRHQGLAEADEVLGLVAEEARGFDETLHLVLAGFREAGGIGKPGEERRGGEVDAGIGALRAQDGGHHQLKGIHMVEGTASIRVGGAEPGLDLAGLGCRLGR